MWVKRDEVRRTIPIAEGLGLVRVPGIICKGLRLNELILWFSHGTWAETLRIKCQSLLGRSNWLKAISTKTHSFEICVEFPTAEKQTASYIKELGRLFTKNLFLIYFFINEMDVKAVGYQHYSKYLQCSTELKSNRFGTSWGWVNPTCWVVLLFKNYYIFSLKLIQN